MLTLRGPWTHEEEVRHSRFIARAAPVTAAEDALAFLHSVREPEATHNCWAYRIADAYRFSDDGEPGGTAGRPILAAIERQGVDGVIVVVTRYYGGTKLGAGGLARAYGGCAASCLRLAPRHEVHPRVRLAVAASFDSTGVVYGLLQRYDAEERSEAYGPTGVTLQFSLRVDEQERFEAELSDVSRGALSVEVL